MPSIAFKDDNYLKNNYKNVTIPLVAAHKMVNEIVDFENKKRRKNGKATTHLNYHSSSQVPVGVLDRELLTVALHLLRSEKRGRQLDAKMIADNFRNNMRGPNALRNSNFSGGIVGRSMNLQPALRSQKLKPNTVVDESDGSWVSSGSNSVRTVSTDRNVIVENPYKEETPREMKSRF